MLELELFEKEYKKHRVKFFKKYFEKSNIKDSLYNAVKKPIIKLVCIRMQFAMAYECITVLNQDNQYWNSLNINTQKEIQTSIDELKQVNMTLDKILEIVSGNLCHLKTDDCI